MRLKPESGHSLCVKCLFKMENSENVMMSVWTLRDSLFLEYVWGTIWAFETPVHQKKFGIGTHKEKATHQAN